DGLDAQGCERLQQGAQPRLAAAGSARNGTDAAALERQEIQQQAAVPEGAAVQQPCRQFDARAGHRACYSKPRLFRARSSSDQPPLTLTHSFSMTRVSNSRSISLRASVP